MGTQFGGSEKSTVEIRIIMIIEIILFFVIFPPVIFFEPSKGQQKWSSS